ncbi:MAG: hypothetical protein ACJ76F_13765 [Bacteroidia bacterium]
MTLWYSARNIFDKTDTGWKKYIDFSGLTQTEEIVFLDSILNDPLLLIRIMKDWELALTNPDNCHFTDCYSNLDYVLSKTKDKKAFNLLALCFQPTSSCNNFSLDNFTFMGYDLLDQSHGNSALTNCGGTPEVFANSELNKFGLVDNYDRVTEIQMELLNNDPMNIMRTQIFGQFGAII